MHALLTKGTTSIFLIFHFAIIKQISFLNVDQTIFFLNIKELYNWDNWDIPQVTTNMQKDLKPQFMGLCENVEVELANLFNNL